MANGFSDGGHLEKESLHWGLMEANLSLGVDLSLTADFITYYLSSNLDQDLDLYGAELEKAYAKHIGATRTGISAWDDVYLHKTTQEKSKSSFSKAITTRAFSLNSKSSHTVHVRLLKNIFH